MSIFTYDVAGTGFKIQMLSVLKSEIVIINDVDLVEEEA
jgi:hypothetical protein